MHTEEELNKAIIELYNDYRDIIKKMKVNDRSYILKLAKINKDESNYSMEEVLYIGLMALSMLEMDMRNNNV